MGDPNVKKDAYTKDSRTLLDEKPIRSPKALQTPKLCFSMKFVIFFMAPSQFSRAFHTDYYTSK
jgi:hypothetical protein